MTTNKDSHTNINQSAVNTHKFTNISKTKPHDYPESILDIPLKPVGRTHTSNIVYMSKKKQLKKPKKHKMIKKAKKECKKPKKLLKTIKITKKK